METEAGPQMDLAVAKAVGFEARVIHDFARGAIVHIPTGRSLAGQSIMREFRPSVDANDAFEAAERCGLFYVADLGISSVKESALWLVTPFRAIDGVELQMITKGCESDGWYPLASGETPAVAICRAILKLSS